MLEQFINRILELKRPELVAVEGRQYSTSGLVAVKEPSPNPLNCDTLTGFVDYITENVDGLAPEDLMIHVTDYKTVLLISALEENWKGRDTFIKASSPVAQVRWGEYMAVEPFIIMLQSCFVESETVKGLLKIVGNVTDGQVNTFTDDGTTQQVTAKVGVSKVENVPVPNPVILAPYRTFIELKQPESRFVFRMKSGQGTTPPACALFEADGGKWKADAVLAIRDWLKEKNLGIPIIA